MKGLLITIALLGTFSTYAASSCEEVAIKAAKTMSSLTRSAHPKRNVNVEGVEVLGSEKVSSDQYATEFLNTYEITTDNDSDSSVTKYAVSITSFTCVLKNIYVEYETIN